QAASGPGRPVEPAEVLAPVTDATTAVAVDDGVVVLHEPSGRVHLLNDTAALVWQHAAGGRDADAVIDAALEARGGSGLDRQAVAATLGELVRAGLVSSEKVT